MKIKYLIYILVAGVFMLQSCDKNFEELNTDPTKTTEAYPKQFLANALINTVNYNMTRNRTFNNELMQVTVSIGDGEGKVFRYDFRRNMSDYSWNGHYSQLSNYKDMGKKALEEINFSRSYQAISLIMQAYSYALLTDTYGDVPFSQSNLGRDSLILEPRFDRQQDIYKGIFVMLDSANSLLRTGATAIDGPSDPLFNGDLGKWRKLGNSLFLRQLLRVSHKAELKDYVVPKIQEILETNTATYPIMSSNADNAILQWTGLGAFVSPYAGVRVQDFRATAICSFFIDYLRDTNDPRLNIPTYGKNGTTRWGIAPVSGDFVGVPSGYAAGSEDFSRMSYFFSSDQNSGSGNTLQTEPLTGIIMNFSEVQFIKAEAALRGWISNGTAENFFYSAVENDIKLWVPTWTSNAKDHLAESDIFWNEKASFNNKLALLHKLKYFALFLVDMQQWYEYRRTGYPVLSKGAGLKNNGEMPARLQYPLYVQSSNPTNYKLAVQEQGADEINTKVWWQKP
ncbi:SusD/RagB family nutrient-binding outer membrane lipoprotein [Sphingobacterium sp. MYb382]|uniref:SusD/RagB family nutrient-binding outer membrane lipoprotein n=1 Tax=Sphingobacterium sp. MYb382 TaxID=2745278 RepID=UPI0030A10B6E